MASLERRAHKLSEVATWRVVWRENGKKQTEVFEIEAGAEEFKRLVEAHGNCWPRGWAPGVGYAESSGPTFENWAERAVASRTRASERTRADYRRDLKSHVYPYFGHLRVQDIRHEDVTAWVLALETPRGDGTALSDKTVRNLHGLVSSIMSDALHQQPPLAKQNPFAGRLGVRATVHTEEMEFLTPSEFQMVLAWIPQHYQPLAVLLAGTGLRFGEATALRVRDVDLDSDRPTLTVVQAWKRQPDSSYVLGEPKTRRSRRTIGISSNLVALLRPLISGRRGDDLLICSVTGVALLNSTFHDVAWRPAVARARVCADHLAEQRAPGMRSPRTPLPCACPGVLDKRPRIHDLRHSHVSWLIRDGVPPAAIARRLGHASITTTMDRYGHLMPDLDDEINEATDRALSLR